MHKMYTCIYFSVLTCQWEKELSGLLRMNEKKHNIDTSVALNIR